MLSKQTYQTKLQTPNV